MVMMMVVMSCGGGLRGRSAGAGGLGSYRSGVLGQLRGRARRRLRARCRCLVGRLGAEGREEVGQERPVGGHGGSGLMEVVLGIGIRPSGHIHTRNTPSGKDSTVLLV